jgi:transcriptional regulator with XRE-family HTH domain
MAKNGIGEAAEILLGKKIEELRVKNGMTHKELGKKIGQIEQQIKKYEAGAFIPLKILEELALALNSQIRKRQIRRISNLRKLEIETGIEQTELLEIYEEVLQFEG